MLVETHSNTTYLKSLVTSVTIIGENITRFIYRRILIGLLVGGGIITNAQKNGMQ